MNGGLLSGALRAIEFESSKPQPQPSAELVAVLCEISVSLRAMAKDISVLRAIAERAETGEREHG